MKYIYRNIVKIKEIKMNRAKLYKSDKTMTKYLNARG